MKQHLRKGGEIRRIEVDTTSGEVINESVTQLKYVAGSKEVFFLMYPAMLEVLIQSTDVNLRLYAALLKRYAQGVEFGISKSFKGVIAHECGCSISSISNAMTTLVKKDILVRLGRNYYKLNPRYVYHGSSARRMVELKEVLQKK